MDRTFLGKPCKRGHLGVRYVSNQGCVDCAKAQSTKNLVLSGVHPDDRQRLIDYAATLRAWRTGK